MLTRFFPLLLLLACSSCSNRASEVKSIEDSGTYLIGYHVPTIPEWKGKFFTRKGSVIHSATYTKESKNVMSTLKFTILTPDKNVGPDTFAKLKRDQDDIDKLMTQVKPASKILERKETSYKGHPAISVKIVDKDVQSTIMRVADGINTLTFAKSIKGRPINQDVEKETNAAWEKLLDGVEIPDKNTKS